MAFTDSKIKNLKPQSKRRIAWEDGGTCLGLRITPTGKKSFVYMYRYDSRPRMMTLGRYPVLTLADARVDLAKAKALLAKGQDPGTLFLQVKADHQGTPTVSHLAAEFIQKRSQNKKAWQEEQRILQKDVLPKWKHRKAQDIKRRDVIVLLDRIVERGSPIMANRTLGVLNRMFNFGIRRAILEGNPCSIIERPGEESPRDRVLSSEEIKNFWINIDKCRMSNGTKLALKFLLVCLQRKSEVAQAEWVDFDINSGWWNIPKEKTKNKLSHRVYLSNTAIELLKKIKELSGDSIYLFPSPRPDRNKPITPRSLSQALLKNLNTLKIEQFAPHDLRRSGSSHMTGNGIPRETVQKILNHVERGVTKVYDRYSYDQEKKNAMTKWGRILNRIITGETGKVIQMRQK
jgi:integrase